MVLRRLHNEDWGFETNCFVCEPRNNEGLRMPFFADDEVGLVLANFTLSTSFSGAPMMVHGGVCLAILDEAQAWAAIALVGRVAVTAETTSRFSRPVLIDRPHVVEARIVDVGATELWASAVIRNERGKDCVASEARFVILSEAQAVRMTGTEIVSAELQRFLPN